MAAAPLTEPHQQLAPMIGSALVAAPLTEPHRQLGKIIYSALVAAPLTEPHQVLIIMATFVVIIAMEQIIMATVVVIIAMEQIIQLVPDLNALAESVIQELHLALVARTLMEEEEMPTIVDMAREAIQGATPAENMGTSAETAILIWTINLEASTSTVLHGMEAATTAKKDPDQEAEAIQAIETIIADQHLRQQILQWWWKHAMQL